MKSHKTEWNGRRESAQVCVSDMLGLRHPALFRQLKNILCGAGINLTLLKKTRDIWVRDFMPIQRHDGVLVSYTYNPDYLRSRYRRLITDWTNVMPPPEMKVVESGLVLDGGNVVIQGRSAIVTNKLFTENPRVSRIQIERRLRELLELDKLIFIPNEPGDIWGHADGMVAWAGRDRVLMNDYRKIDRRFHREIKDILLDAHLTVTEVPYDPDIKPGGIPSARGNYTNLLVLPDLVVMPEYGLPDDARAFERIMEAFADHTVLTIDASSAAGDGGSIHCLTW